MLAELHFLPSVEVDRARLRAPLAACQCFRISKAGPMTTQVKGYPFEVVLAGKEVAVVLADPVKSLDWLPEVPSARGR